VSHTNGVQEIADRSLAHHRKLRKQHALNTYSIPIHSEWCSGQKKSPKPFGLGDWGIIVIG